MIAALPVLNDGVPGCLAARGTGRRLEGAAPGSLLILSLVGHRRGRLLHRIIKRKRELTDESKSVSSLFMNNEKVLPNRCHGGL